MFAALYRKIMHIWGKLPAHVALVALIASGLVVTEAPLSANAAIVTNNLVMNLDGTSTSSLPATGNWSSISPGTGTFSGAISGATRAGGTYGGLTSDGAADYVNFGTNSGAITGSMTFETWVKPSSFVSGSWNVIASRWFDSTNVNTSSTPDWHFAMYHNGTSANLQLDTSTQSAPLRGTTTFPLTSANKWYLVGFVIDATSGKAQIFVNGASDSAQATMSHSASTSPIFQIGDSRTAGNSAFNGQISKVRMYSSALSAADITQNYLADSAFYGYAPANTVAPTLGGKARVGSTLYSSTGTWGVGDADGTTTTYAWQYSLDGTTNWTTISGATSASYTPTSSDATRYLRSAVTKTNSAGTSTAYSASTAMVLTADTTVINSGGKLTGLSGIVPNDSGIYNVTLASSNLSSTMTLGTTTGLTCLAGYSTTASYLNNTSCSAAPIVTFRGAGTAINTALTNISYTSSNIGQTDVVKLYWATGSSTNYDTKNYIPIYDNGKLTFHYYALKTLASATWSAQQTALASTGTIDGVVATNGWYLTTMRYNIEWQRVKDIAAPLVATTAAAGFIGNSAAAGSNDWYWPANTDGFSTATKMATQSGTTMTAPDTTFDGTTSLPYCSGEPNAGNTVARAGYIYHCPSAIGWDDVPATATQSGVYQETYSTTVLNTGSTGTFSLPVRVANLASAPTGLTAGLPGTTVTLNWTAPSSLGTDPLVDYTIQYSSDGTTWNTWAHTDSTATTAAVTGLSATTNYQFRVAAYTSDQGPFSNVTSTGVATGTLKSLPGFSVPASTTGTIRVLLFSSNANGRLWVQSAVNIDGGIRGTANYPDSSGATPTYQYNPANINSAGRMIGLVDTSVTDLNNALATLRYQSSSASTDTISMWISNGSEYIPIVNGSTVEFHYYGFSSTTGNKATMANTSNAGAARTIDGVSLAAGTSFLTTPRYRSEEAYLHTLVGTTSTWINASDSVTEGTWKWGGTDATGTFWTGTSTGTLSTGEFANWASGEPNDSGANEDCATLNVGSTYSANTIAASGSNYFAWNDLDCASTGIAYTWEAYQNNNPYGSNTTNPAGSNYSAPVYTQAITVATPAASPTALTATSTVDGQVDLSWTAPASVTGITSYSIQYSNDGTTWAEDRATASTATTESITSLTSGTGYTFRVAAIVGSTVGSFAYTYFTPTGTPKVTVYSYLAKTITTLTLDSSLNSKYVSVLLRSSGNNISLGTTTNIGAIRGTANATTRTTAGTLIGLTGLGSDVNAALATLTYANGALTSNQTITMWTSVGTASALPQEYVPVVNATTKQVEFHYFGYSGSAENGPWSLASAKAAANTSTINGQAVSGKYLATAESADQNAAIGSVMAANSITTRVWLGAGDYTTVGSSNAEGAWYWLGPDTGTTQFYNGTSASGTGGVTNSSYVSWGASSSAQSEPSGGNAANCLTAAATGAYTYSWVNGTISAISSPTSTWDDWNCNDTGLGYAWEVITNAPVGTTTLGDNYAGVKAQSLELKKVVEAPTAITATNVANGSAVLIATPGANNGATLTGYRFQWGTDSTFTTSSWAAPGSNGTIQLVNGLTNGTTYYARVLTMYTATGTAYWSEYSPTVTFTPASTATTINLVSSGGGVAGTDYLVKEGIIYLPSATATSANVNVSDVTNLLATGHVTLAADNVNINAPITYSGARYLTLGSSTLANVSINQSITFSGSGSQLLISPASYALDVKNGAKIQFTAASTQYLNIGGTSYTIIKNEAALANVLATGNFAIGQSFTLTTAYTSSAMPIQKALAGTLDGLGNTVSGMKLAVSASGPQGFIQTLAGGTVRNLGVTNSAITIGTYTGDLNVGGVIGSSTGGTISQVWSSGFIKTTSGSTVGNIGAGGILGWAPSGTTTITKSWSNVGLDLSTATYNYLTAGGIVGGDASAYGQANTSPGGNLDLRQVYSLGTLKWTTAAGWHGVGGILGLHYSTGTLNIADAFSWSALSRATDANNYNYGGIAGVAQGGATTASNIYTAASLCTDTNQAASIKACTASVIPGATVSAITGSNWTSTGATVLANLAAPVKTLWVQVVAPSNGAYSGITYQLNDGLGNAYSAADLTALNLTVTGTPTYSIASNVAISATPYNVDYVSGLTIGGTAASGYSLKPFLTSTAVTISKLSQTVTWAPTTAITFTTGSFTPSTAATASGGTTITYSVASQGMTGCVVNASTGVVSAISAGNCAITATAANSGNYLDASTTVTFVIGAPATAPTVTTVASSANSVLVNWTAPTVSASAALTGYQILYSTASDMSGATTISTGNTNLSRAVTGLTSGTTYYFQVRAISGSTWVGPVNATGVAGTPRASASTITVVASGGGTLGTDYKISNGVVYTDNATASVNVADIQSALLTNNVTIAAENIVINTPITWSTSQTLTLGTVGSGSLDINGSISASGASAGLVIASTNYNLKVSTGTSIVLSGASSTLSIGGNAYTLIRATADLSTVTATGYYALAQPIAYSTTIATAPINVAFAGTFDGLGNTVDLMKIRPAASGTFGFFSTLNGATVRNLGLTRAWTSMSSAITTTSVISGILAGESSGTTNVTQVWTSGHNNINQGTITRVGLGGIIGNVTAGTLTLSKSWSSVSLNSSGATITSVAIGGLVASNVALLGNGWDQVGGSVVMNQVYSTGNISWANGTTWRGYGGLLGIAWSTGTTSITDGFSWSPMSNVDANYGGLIGAVAGGAATVTRAYTTSASSLYSSVTYTPTSVTAGVALGTNVSSLNTANWSSSGPSKLVNLADPYRPAYVVVGAPANGAYSGITYGIYDGFAVTDLSTLSVSSTGTPTYTIASNVGLGTYSVDYVSGLTLSGTNAPYYKLASWPVSTSVTISKLPQTVTWTPTTAISFGSGTVTPATATASGGTTISYSVTSAGTTGCTVNASTGVLTYTRGGSCQVTATAANAGNYLSATDVETFVITEPATAPTSVAATTAGSGALSIGWTAPTVSASAAITGYTLTYSTSSSMTSPTTVSVGATTGYLLTGLTAGTTYYFQVNAVSGSTWIGPSSTVASATPNSTATSLTIAATGTGVAGTDYFVKGGVISAVGSTTISASAVAAVLASEGTVQLAATTVNINSDISWSSNAVLVLGNTSAATVNVNASLIGSGTTAGVKILPSAYSLAIKSAASIRLTGTTPSFNLGGTAYTVVNSVAGLANVSAASVWALTAPISLTTVYSTAVKDITFTGTMDGLGNTIDGMQITPTATGNFGFYNSLNGATVRNVGFTNVNLSVGANAYNKRFGSLAGNGNSSTGTSNVTKVWSTGFMSDAGTAAGSGNEMGGIVGGQTAGTLNLTQVWSSVTLTTSTITAGVGGIIGTNVSTFAGTNGAGGTTVIKEAYSTGNVSRTGSQNWYGVGGVIGVAYGPSTTINDTFTWGNLNASTNVSTGGIAGVASSTSPVIFSNGYTAFSSCYSNGSAAPAGNSYTACTTSVAPGTTISTLNSAVWASNSTNGSYLVNLPLPTLKIYVQVVAPTDGSFAGPGGVNYKIVDSTGTEQTAALLTAKNISVSGTPTYNINGTTAKGTYNAAYVSGLTIGGTSASLYSLLPWINTTSVTISKYPQTVTWSPTTAIRFGTGTFTPSALASSDKGTTITYSVSSAGATGCTVNSSTGVVTYTSAGTCSITATGDSTGDYLTSAVTVSFVIAAAPTLTVVATGGGTSGTDYFVSGGVITANANASITVTDLTTLLSSSSVQLAGNVVINTPITWSANTTLTLGGTSTNTVAVNAKVTASGNTAGIAIVPATYTLDVKNGAALVLSGTTSTLSIGGASYTLIRSTADFANVTTSASGKWAIAQPLTFTSAVTNSPVALSMAGTLDGLGNTVDKLTMTYAGAYGAGLIKNLAGATVRNLGITNTLITMDPGAVTGQYNDTGALTGESSGATIDQVWTTGSIRVKSGANYAGLALGGIVGLNSSGTLTITKSWSSVSMTSSGGTYTHQFSGGLVGGNLSSWTATSTTTSGNVSISQSFYSGDIQSPQTTGTTGLGGIIGVHTGTGTVSLSDNFSWGSIWIATGFLNYGGMIGNSVGGTLNLATNYSITNKSYPTTVTPTSISNTYYGVGIGATAGMTTNANWYQSTNGTALVNLPMPTKNLYTQVVAPTDGSFGTVSTQTVNGVGVVQSLSSLSLTVSGTPTYSNITSSTALGTYSVDYSSGLTYGGAKANLYNFLVYPWSTSVTLSKYNQTITLTSTAPTTAKVGATYTLTGSASSSLAVSYTIDSTTTSICSISGAVVTFNAIGDCKINANQAGNTSYLAAPQVQQTATITQKGDQTISFTSTAPTTAVVGGTTYTPTATSTSTGTVAFTIDAASSAVCSIASGVVSFNAVGTCKVLADQAGGTNWNAAAQNFQSFTVGKGTPTLAFTSSPATPKVGATYTPIASSSSTGTVSYTIDSTTTSICSITTGVVSFLTVGTCKLNAAQVTDTNWLAVTQTQQSITVAKGDQTITFTSTAPTTAVVSGSTYTPTATSTSTGAVTFTIDAASSTICSITSGVVSFQRVGTCKVLADQAGGTNWNAATQNFQSFTVGKGTPILTFTTSPATPKVGSTYTPTATSAYTGAVTYSTTTTTYCTISAGVVSFIAAGTCVIKADQAGDANWNAATQVTQTISVLKADQIVAFTSTAPTSAVVGGTAYTVAASGGSSTSSIAFTIDSSASTVCSITGTSVTFQTVGTCVVNLNQAGDANYNAAAQVQQSFSVGKGSQVVAFGSNIPNAAKVGGSTYLAVATGGASTSGITLTVDASTTSNCSVSGMTVTYLAVGDCVINLNQAGDANYNAAAQVQQRISITTDGRCPFGVVSGNYCLIRFNSSGTWTVPSGISSVDILAVGGGGAGGGGAGTNIAGGGGGGGQVTEILGRAVTPGNALSITVGDGGIGGGSAAISSGSTAGSQTLVTGPGSFAQILALGGGQGAGWSLSAPSPGVALPAGTGASVAGGGGGSAQTLTRTAAPGTGSVSNGGVASPSNTDSNAQAAGGGGGAGGNGSDALGNAAGNGGLGKNSVILGTLLGGGGGGGKRTSVGGSAGTSSAGGGAGGFGAAGSAGSANTGGGGGGSGGSGNGGNGGSGVVVIRIALSSQSVAFTSTAPTGLVYGTSTTYTPTVSGTASEASPVITVDAASSAVCTISAGVVSIVGAGTCTLNANQAANGFYAAATQVQQSFTVAKADQTISFISTAPSAAAVNGTTYTPTATSTSTGAVAFTIDAASSAVCSIAAGVVSFQTVGTCKVLANQAGGTNWNAATQVFQSFAVGKGSQTITFTSTAPSAAVVSGTTYTPTATSTSTGSVTFTIDAASSAICSISAGVVSFQKAGTCKVLADQAGGTNWNAASQVFQSFSVGKGTPTLAFSSTATSPKVNTTYTPTATSAGTGIISFTIDSTTSAICSISSGVVSFNAVGVCKVNAAQVSDSNWLAVTQVTQSITVLKGDQVISFSSTAPSAAVVGGTTYTPTASSTSTGAVAFSIDAASSSVCSIANGVVSFNAIGTCKVLADQAGGTNWNTATQNFQSFTVGKGTPTLAFTSNASSPKVNTTYTPVASSSSTGSVSYTIDSTSSTICSITNGVVSFAKVGTCKVNAAQATDSNWLAVTQTQQVITVLKGDQTVAFDSTAPSAAVVDGSTYTPTATATSGATVAFTIDHASSAVCSISAGVVSFNDVGTCKVLANQAGSSDWNAAAQVFQTFTVGKGSQVVQFTSSAPSNAVVDGSTYLPVVTGGASGNAVSVTVASASSSICSINLLGRVEFRAVGDCVLLLNQAGSSKYEAASEVQQTISVAKGSQVISFASVAPRNAVVDGGTYAVSATGGAGTEAITYSISNSSARICSIASGVVSFLTVGDCVILANKAGDNNYLAATEISQTVSVGKGSQSVAFISTAPTTVHIGDLSEEYTPAASGGASTSPIVISIASAAASICHITAGVVSYDLPGDCVVEVSQAGDNNYLAASTVTQTISVQKGTQVLNWSVATPLDAVVDGPTFTPSATGGPSSKAVVLSIDATSSTVCRISNGSISFLTSGECLVLANQAGDAAWNAASQISMNILVGKGSQSISFVSTAPTNAIVSGAGYTPSATGGASGRVVTFRTTIDSASVCSIAGGVVSFVGTGTCVVEANQAGDSNYLNATPAQQSFTVGKGNQVILFSSSAPTGAKVGAAAYTPTAIGGLSGNQLTFSIASASSSICSLATGKVTYQAPGDCVIEANQAGNRNYNAATTATQTVSVAKGSQAVAFTSTFANAKVGGTTYSPVATGGASGNAASFSIAPSSTTVCSISNGIVSFTAVGSCVINADQAGDSNWNAAPTVSQTIAVAKGVQVVQFTSTPPHNAQVQGLTYTPTATGTNSGNAVVFTVPASAQIYCTISGGVVSFHAVGNCVLNANQAGSSNWNAATQVSQVFDVTKGQQVISFTTTAPTNAIVEGATYAVDALGGNGTAPVTYSISPLSTDLCAVTGNTVSFTAPGDCVVVANQAGDSQFNAANPITQTISVAKGIQTLSIGSAPSNAMVDGTSYSPVISTGNSSSPASISTANPAICEISGSTVIFHASDDCTIYVDQAGDERFEPAPRISQTFHVARGYQAALVGRASIRTLVLGGLSSPTTVLSVSGGSGTGAYSWHIDPSYSSICSVTDDVVTGLAAGRCIVSIAKAEDANYFDTSNVVEILVSTGDQAALVTEVSDPTPVFAPGLTVTLSVTGGAGTGALWFESTNPHVCNTDGGSTIHILHAGLCEIVTHKDGDSNYQSAFSNFSFTIAKATQSAVTLTLSDALRYSSTATASADLVVGSVASSGTQALSVTSGSCVINNGKLESTVAGDCEVTLTIDGDENYEPLTLAQTFTVAKSAQSTLTAALVAEQPSIISTIGVNATTYEISGGSGPGALTAVTADENICRTSVSNNFVVVAGIGVGTCEISVIKAASDNYAQASTHITLSVVSLPTAPSGITLANTNQSTADGMKVRVGWTAPVTTATQAPVSGYEIQYLVGSTWTTLPNGVVPADVASFDVVVPPWTTLKLRVGSVSTVDPSNSADRNWTVFSSTNNEVPTEFKVPGALKLISTNLAAVTSGEVVTLTGTGFEVGVTTKVELTSSASVFGASLRAAAIANTIQVPATVISPTQLTFVLPKIKLPAGQTSLPTQVKVLSENGIASQPAQFNYIPKKLTQAMTMTGTFPAASTILMVGTTSADNLVTNAGFTSTGLAPVVTTSPESVCTARLNDAGKLVIDPVSPGKCTITVQAPATPGYLPSAAKVTSVIVKQNRTPGFTVAVRQVGPNGTYGTPQTFTQIGTLLQAGAVNVELGDDPVELQVGMVTRQGTTLFTVNPADEAAGRCTADPGDPATPFGSIMITDVGDCSITISQPVDSGWLLGETIKLIIHTTARTTPAPPDNGSASPVPANELADILDPLDPDDLDTPPVQLSINGSTAAPYEFGGEDGVDYDPVAGKFTFRTKSPLVGTWSATLKSPNVAKKWFKIPGKVVKKVQQYTMSNICAIKLVVKKDPKLKKKVLRIIGTCLLSDEGKAAMTAVGIQKIVIKYKRTRQYAKTGLDYQGTAKAKKRILKKVNRTVVLKVGRVS